MQAILGRTGLPLKRGKIYYISNLRSLASAYIIVEYESHLMINCDSPFTNQDMETVHNIIMQRLRMDALLFHQLFFPIGTE